MIIEYFGNDEWVDNVSIKYKASTKLYLLGLQRSQYGIIIKACEL